MLLVATPALLDPNFADTVVLLLDVDENGALGVVLNRPSAVPVAEVLADWRDVVAEPEVLFQGGPVSTEGALAVALASRADDVPVGFREVFGQLGVVDLDTPVELVDGTLRGCGSSPGTPAGAPSSWTARSRRAAGTSYRRSRPTCSGWTRPTCGATSCAGSPASSPGTPPGLSTRT